MEAYALVFGSLLLDRRTPAEIGKLRRLAVHLDQVASAVDSFLSPKDATEESVLHPMPAIGVACDYLKQLEFGPDAQDLLRSARAFLEQLAAIIALQAYESDGAKAAYDVYVAMGCEERLPNWDIPEQQRAQEHADRWVNLVSTAKTLQAKLRSLQAHVADELRRYDWNPLASARGAIAPRSTQVVAAEVNESQDPDFDVPPLNTDSSEWITQVSLSNDGNYGIQVNSLKNARARGSRSADHSVGVDDSNRMWRRDPTNAQVFWYYLPSLKPRRSVAKADRIEGNPSL
jgi:hypothetical protein